LFATADRSVTDESKAKALYKLLRDKFPEKDGYSISVSHCPGTSYDVTDEMA
jgi:hypothetical protein